MDLLYVPGSKLLLLGMESLLKMGIYTPKPQAYRWVDDHPLLYGSNGSLDPGTYICMFEKKIPNQNLHLPRLLGGGALPNLHSPHQNTSSHGWSTYPPVTYPPQK